MMVDNFWWKLLARQTKPIRKVTKITTAERCRNKQKIKYWKLSKSVLKIMIQIHNVILYETKLLQINNRLLDVTDRFLKSRSTNSIQMVFDPN